MRRFLPEIPPALAGRITARTVDEAECVASVVLAILLARWLGAAHISWAAYAGYMVLRGHVAETLSRGLLRMAGTVIGGFSALMLAPLLADRAPVAALALLLVATASLYATLTARRAYGWLFFGLTFAMVALDKMERPDIALDAFVRTRIVENVAGTLACMAVSLVSAITLRRFWPGMRTPPTPIVGWDRAVFGHALQGGIAVALLTLVGMHFALPALAQGAVTIMAVMLVPVSGIGAGGATPVRERLRHRFLGCIAGALIAGLLLIVARGSAPVLMLGTLAGVVAGRHLENGTSPWRYAGMQFSLAILVILVPDSYANAGVEPGMERLAGILAGMAVLEPILLLGRLAGRGRARDAGHDMGAGKRGDI